MSKSLIHQVSITALCGLFLGAGAMMAMNNFAEKRSNVLQRNVASTDPVIGNAKDMGKHLAVVNVQIDSSPIPKFENDEIILTGYITLNQPVDTDLRYRWVLPDGVALVAGETEDSVAQVQNGQTIKTEIAITGFSKESLKLITLHGFVQKGDQQFGNTAIMTSRPEDSMEFIAPGMAQSALAKDIRDGKKTRGKIIK